MFIGRNPDGSIYGLWTTRQFEGQEELPEDHADLVAHRAKQKAASINSKIKAQIAELEMKQGRALREAALGMAGAVARLTTIESDIIALRAQMK